MPIGLTKKDIADMALGLLGQEPLDSYEEDTRNGRTIRLFYESARLGVLEDYPWSFATKRMVLAPLSQAPSFGWSYQFALPSDFLKEQYVRNDSDSEIEYRIEGEKLLADSNVIRFIYTYDEPLESRYTAKFAELLAHKLAAKACYTVTQSRSEEQALSNSYSGLLIEAMSNDSQGDGEPKILESSGNWTTGI